MSASYVSASLRRRVQERAFGCCEYCLLSADDAFYSHEPDHIVAIKHGGESSLENLAWACFDCNRFKGSDVELICNGTGLHWPALDEDLSLLGILEGRLNAKPDEGDHQSASN